MRPTEGRRKGHSLTHSLSLLPSLRYEARDSRVESRKSRVAQNSSFDPCTLCRSCVAVSPASFSTRYHLVTTACTLPFSISHLTSVSLLHPPLGMTDDGDRNILPLSPSFTLLHPLVHPLSPLPPSSSFPGLSSSTPNGSIPRVGLRPPPRLW